MTLGQVKWLRLTDVADERGHLTAVEGGKDVPFPIARVFYVHHVTPGTDRGSHAHRDTDQVAVAAHGSLRIDVSDGVDVVTYELTDPGRGLFLPRMIWVRLYDFSPGAVLLVFASTQYDRSRSMRTWPDYLAARDLPGTGGENGRALPPGEEE